MSEHVWKARVMVEVEAEVHERTDGSRKVSLPSYAVLSGPQTKRNEWSRLKVIEYEVFPVVPDWDYAVIEVDVLRDGNWIPAVRMTHDFLEKGAGRMQWQVVGQSNTFYSDNYLRESPEMWRRVETR